MSTKINSVLLQNYVEQLDTFSKSNLINSEINTRTKLVDPLLELLGWDVRSNNVTLEYPIKLGSSTVHVDYALLKNNRPIVLVESKPLSSSLTRNYSNQINSYCRVERVRWAALSNGKTLKIFDSDKGKYEHDTLICEIDLRKPSDYVEELTLLHKDTVLSGEIDELASRIFRYKKAITTIKNSKNELADGYNKIITKIAGSFNPEKIKLIASHLATITVNLLEEEKTSKLDYTTQKELPYELTPVKDNNIVTSVNYWITPVKSDEYGTARDTILTLVKQEGIYAFGNNTPGRKSIKAGDWICFYESKKGVVAHAQVNSSTRKEINPKVRATEKYPWIFDLTKQKLYLDNPVELDRSIRKQLEALNKRGPDAQWGWFVQATRRISQHDFHVLTR